MHLTGRVCWGFAEPLPIGYANCDCADPQASTITPHFCQQAWFPGPKASSQQSPSETFPLDMMSQLSLRKVVSRCFHLKLAHKTDNALRVLSQDWSKPGLVSAWQRSRYDARSSSKIVVANVSLEKSHNISMFWQLVWWANCPDTWKPRFQESTENRFLPFFDEPPQLTESGGWFPDASWC